MEFEWRYKKAMQEYDLTLEELPEDAKTGIQSIDDAMRAITTLEKKGQKPQQRTVKKLQALDKWVYFEILDYVQETDKNDEVETATATKEEIVKEVEKQVASTEKPAATATATVATATATKEEKSATAPEPEDEGLVIEGELEQMFKSGTKDWEFDAIKPVAKKTHAVLFEGYEAGKENGITTSKFSLIETKEKVFTLTQL